MASRDFGPRGFFIVAQRIAELQFRIIMWFPPIIRMITKNQNCSSALLNQFLLKNTEGGYGIEIKK